MGPYYNWVQVFGKVPWLWLIPTTKWSGKPVGDGVVWPTRLESKLTNSPSEEALKPKEVFIPFLLANLALEGANIQNEPLSELQ
jgi:hypothetical protein